MSRRHEESPWQLWMDFTHPPLEEPPVETSSLYPAHSGLFANPTQHEPGLGRFVRRIHEATPARSPVDVATYFLEHIYTPWEEFTQEEIYTLMLNNRNCPTYSALIYRGTLNSVHIRTAEIFRPAIQVNAASIIMAHNHPSGDSEPSPEDIRVSNQIFEAGHLLDVRLLDSLIIGEQSFVSLKERGLLGD